MGAPFPDADLMRAPRLQRLLTPEEKLLYTVRFHPLRGWWVLLPGLACMAAAWWWPPALLPGLLLLGLWYLPLYTNEVAVTDDRLLMRTGWLNLRLIPLQDETILRWEMTQTALGSLLDYGTVQIIVRERELAGTRVFTLPWVWGPVTFLEAMQAMQDEKYRDGTA